MVEPLPRWARACVVAVVVAGLAFAVVRWRDDGLGRAQPADWHVAPGADLGPASRRVPVTVLERGCASGRDAEGRIEASVRYERDRVTIDIGVRPYGGGQDCQSHPSTPYVVHLDEPLGDRPIAGAGPGAAVGGGALIAPEGRRPAGAPASGRPGSRRAGRRTAA